MRHHEAIDDNRNVANVLGNLGDLAYQSGYVDEALSYARKSLTIWERVGDRYGIGLDCSNIGAMEIARGNLDAAVSALRTAAEKFRELGDPWQLAGTIENAARVAVMRGKYAVAARMLGYSKAVVARCGVPRQPNNEREHETTMAQVAAMPDTEAIQREISAGGAMTLAEAAAMLDELE
jgi:tetratricopeptide (TPR) repeat protein